MHESTSAPSAHPAPPDGATPGETRARIAFQVDHPEVGFARQALCEEPDERWVAYWLGEDGKAHHITGGTLGDVLKKLKKEFGTPAT